MAAKKANLASALDDVTPAPSMPVRHERPATVSTRQGTSLVGAHLPAKYQKALKILSAESGKSQRDLLAEALDMLFVAKGTRLDS